MINIVNKSTHSPTKEDVYIGRGSPLGNPFDWRGSPKAKFKVSSRKEAIKAYDDWLHEQCAQKNEEVLDELRKIYRMAKLSGVNLVCFCSPDNDCHGRVIKEFIESHL